MDRRWEAVAAAGVAVVATALPSARDTALPHVVRANLGIGIDDVRFSTVVSSPP